MESCFICKICNKEFKYKSHFSRHTNSNCHRVNNNEINKIDVSNIVNLEELTKMLHNINQKIYIRNKKTKDTICGYCNRKYSSKTNLQRHILLSCIDKNTIYNNKELITKQIKIIKLIKNDNINTEEKETEDKTIVNNINNGIINNTNNTINNTNQLIVINNFGKDDLSHIPNKNFITYINKMYSGLVNLIEDINFSDNNKNNFNVYLTSIRNEFANIYENNTWKLKDVDDVIYQIKDDKIAILDKKVEEINDDKLRDTLETFKNRLYSNAEAEKNLNKNIKLIMVNNSEKIIAQRKITKKSD